MSPVRALHLFGNFKWTGPADPAIRTVRGLRVIGVDAVFAQARFMRGDEHWMAAVLRRHRMPVTGDLQLPKHFRLSAAWRDGRVLAARLGRGDFDLLHANLLSDHVSASLAKRLHGRRAGPRSGLPVLVRSIYEPEAPPRNLRTRFAFANTDGVVAPTRRCAETLAQRFRLDPTRIHVQEPTTDVRRFDGLDGDLRESFGASPDDVLIGITARVQPHRRFAFLWEVARRVVDECPEAKFVLLGRGHPDDLRDLVHDPIDRLGLRDHVILPGYLEEPEYSQALRSLDLFTFLVPGSDGTCRAVREALAAGLPVVTTKRGILPDLVSRRYEGPAREPCGLAMEEDEAEMAGALRRLIRNREARETLRNAALARVRELMDEVPASHRLLEFYTALRERVS